MCCLSDTRRALLLAVFFLTVVAQSGPGYGQTYVPDSRDLQICKLASDVVPAELAGYLVSSAIFDIDGDGTPERLSIGYQGSARSPTHEIVRANGTEVALTLPHGTSPEDDWNWSWGKKWLIHDGRGYALRFSGRGTGYLRSVSRVDQDFTERPICKFSPRTDTRLRSKIVDDTELCRAVQAGQVAPLDIAPDSPRAIHNRKVPGGNTYSTGHVNVDYLNDGRTESLLLVNAASGAGSGCDLSYYDTVPTKFETPDHVVLMKMQSLDLSDVWPRRTCHDDTPRWFVFDGQSYLETKSQMAANPGAEAMEYHWVDTIENGVARRICEGEYVHRQPKLIGVWTGTGWQAPEKSK